MALAFLGIKLVALMQGLGGNSATIRLAQKGKRGGVSGEAAMARFAIKEEETN